MKRKTRKLKLPEGDFEVEILKFKDKDCESLIVIYDNWRKLCKNLIEIGARAVNIPEGLSETAVCIAKKMWRVNSGVKKGHANTSFDCYDKNGSRNNNRIQVKACSVRKDLTSFGPKSKWDRIFFADFYREGKWDRTFDLYEIDTKDIYDFIVNKKDDETVDNQKEQRRRPRFSINEGLIKEEKYISKETFKITVKGIVKYE